MKKLITSVMSVVLFSTVTFAQNLVTNPGFEADIATFTVAETTTNVLMRVAALTDVTTQTANPTASATPIPAGMWVKKAANSGYIKGVITSSAYKSGASSLNLKITTGTTQTGLGSWYNCVALQKINGGLSNTKKYRASVWARLDDTTPNASVNIYLFVTDNTAKVNITKTIPLSGGTTWTKYETVFDLPTHITTNPTANFGTAFFGAGMTTTYDNSVPTVKTNYSGLLIDDFTLEEDISTDVTVTSIESNLLLNTGNGLVSLKAGELTIYTLSGSKMSQQLVQVNEKITLPRGMYVAQLKFADGISTQKVNL